MLCIHFYMPDNRIVRIKDEDAHCAVKTGKARYIPRRVWKEKVRDANSTQIVETA